MAETSKDTLKIQAIPGFHLRHYSEQLHRIKHREMQHCYCAAVRRANFDATETAFAGMAATKSFAPYL
jgi:hypothetical protein